MAAQGLSGDQLLFAPVKQLLSEQHLMRVTEPLESQVMRSWLEGKTIFNKPFDPGNEPAGKDTQALVADMYIFMREREVLTLPLYYLTLPKP
jgi:hypothetical protein